ncbi:MAG: hypothetical protein ACTSWY_06425 [Promethearchaeota archaeon]
MSFKDIIYNIREYIYSLVDKFRAYNSELNGVMKNNKGILKAHIKVNKETKDGINSLKEYFGKGNIADSNESDSNEIKDIMQIFEKIENIENNRCIMIEQFQDQIINPLNRLFGQWQQLHDDLREEEEDIKKFERAKKNLKKKESKPWDKLGDNDLEKAGKRYNICKRNVAESKKVTEKSGIEFNKQKNITKNEILKAIGKIYGEFFEKSAYILEKKGAERENKVYEKDKLIDHDNLENKMDAEKTEDLEDLKYEIEMKEGIEVIYVKE